MNDEQITASNDVKEIDREIDPDGSIAWPYREWLVHCFKKFLRIPADHLGDIVEAFKTIGSFFLWIVLLPFLPLILPVIAWVTQKSNKKAYQRFVKKKKQIMGEL